MIERIADCSAHRPFGDVLRLLDEQPSVEAIHRGTRTGLSHRQVIVGPYDLERLGLVLDTIHIEDEIERVPRGKGRVAERLEEFPSDVRDAAGALAPIDVGDAIVSSIAIDDERAGGATEYGERRLARAVTGKAIGDQIVGEEGPDETTLVGLLHLQ